MAGNYLQALPLEPPTTDQNMLAPAPTMADAYDYNSSALANWIAQQRAQSVAMGLLDPETGLPTKKGIVDAARQFANTMLMGSVAPEAKAIHPLSEGTWLHGTAGNHNTLDPAFIGSVTSNTEPGFWFTKNPQYANQYAFSASGRRGEDPRVLGANLSLTNPLVVHFNEDMKPVVDGNVKDWDNNYDIVKYAQDNGHDGVIFPDGNFSEESNAAVVFDPSKISVNPE